MSSSVPRTFRVSHISVAALAALAVTCVIMLAAAPLAQGATQTQAWLFATARTYHPTQKPEIGVRGQGLKSLWVDVYSFDGASYFSEAGQEGFWNMDVAKLPGRQLAKSVSVPIDRAGKPAVSSVVLDPLPPGCYVALPRSSGIRSAYPVWFTVSAFGLVTKQSASALLVHAVDILTGAPVAGVEVKASLYPSGWQEPAEAAPGPVRLAGTTGSDGLWRAAASSPSSSAVIIGVRGHEVQVASSYHWFDSRQHAAYVYTDRPIYRPGNTVSFKGIVRRILDPGYSIPEGSTVDVEVTDSKGNRIYRQQLPLSSWGSFDGSLVLADEPALGRYSIAVSVDGEQHWSSFDVAEYRKPEWSVEVRFDRDRYIAGDALESEVSAVYYFGSPVQDAQVDYRVYRQRTGFLGDLGASAAGGFRHEYYGYYQGQELYWQEFVTSGTARTDSSGKVHLSFKAPLSSYGDGNYVYMLVADVTDSTGKVASGSGSVLVAGGTFDAQVVADRWIVSPNQEFSVKVLTVTSDGSPASRQLALDVLRRRWHKDGYTDTPVSRMDVSTSARGEAAVGVTVPEAGEYIILASGTDERGNRVEASTWIWASSREGGVRSERSDMVLVVDRERYSIGDTARVVVSGPSELESVLVTVEDRELRFAQVVPMRDGSASIDVEIKPEYAPNTWVSATAVSDGVMQTASREIAVDDPDTSLVVEISPNKAEYRPGETATFTISARDAKGEPVSAELSFALVDEAVFAVRADSTPDITQFFHGRRYQAVTTENSFPVTYYGGADKEGGAQSDRKYFPDTATWLPSVVTDANGRAVIKLKIPDSLTTWRATVRAHSRDTLVGQAVAKVKVSLPLAVRLGLPRFYTLGDSGSVAGVVHNDTASSRRVSVTLQAQGADIDGPAKRYVTVPAFGSATVEWTIRPRAVGEVVLSARVRSWFTTDGVEMRVPVNPFGEPGGATMAGETDGAGAEVSLELPEALVPGSVGAWVDLSPGYLGLVAEALEQLVAYPYGCVEQTMSAFLPDLVAQEVQRKLGVPSPRSDEELSKMVNDGLARLYRHQHDDGGFGWWEYDSSDPWMTSYVLYGYAVARQAGYDVAEGSARRAVDYLGSVVSQLINQRDQAFAAYALALHGALAGDGVKALEGLAERVTDAQATAFVALAAHALGDAELAAHAVGKLAAQAVRGDGQAVWRTEDPDRPWRSESAESTAWALMALASTGADRELASEAARHLANARQGAWWQSTRHSAAAVMALAKFVDYTGERGDSGAPTVTVFVNGERLSSVKVAGATRVNIDAAKLRQGRNTVRIQSDGGRAYFAVEAQWHRAAQHVDASGESAQIIREYLLIDRTTPADERGNPATLPLGDSHAVRAGQEVLVRVRIRANQNLEYMAFEDPLPSGFEVSDGFDDPYSWTYWYSRKEVRDNRVVVFAGSIPKGEERVYEYVMVPERPGDYLVMPTTAWSMYYPDQHARGASARIRVVPR